MKSAHRQRQELKCVKRAHNNALELDARRLADRGPVNIRLEQEAAGASIHEIILSSSQKLPHVYIDKHKNHWGACLHKLTEILEAGHAVPWNGQHCQLNLGCDNINSLFLQTAWLSICSS